MYILLPVKLCVLPSLDGLAFHESPFTATCQISTTNIMPSDMQRTEEPDTILKQYLRYKSYLE